MKQLVNPWQQKSEGQSVAKTGTPWRMSHLRIHIVRCPMLASSIQSGPGVMIYKPNACFHYGGGGDGGWVGFGGS